MSRTTYTITSVADWNNDISAINFASQQTGATPVDYIFNIAPASGTTIAQSAALDAVNLAAGFELLINGGGNTRDGGGLYNGLFVYAGVVDIANLTIADARAVGGGGLGAGGDIFVRQGGRLIVSAGTLGSGIVTGATSPACIAGGTFANGLFSQGNQTVTLDPASGSTLSVSSVVTDQTSAHLAAGLGPPTGSSADGTPNAGSGGLAFTGTGTQGIAPHAGTLDVPEGANSEALALGTMAVAGFMAAADGHGGTSVTAVAAPLVTAVSVPANGTYGIGTMLDFGVTFSSPVTVTGTPRLAVTLATGGTEYATYVSGSGTSTLILADIVKAGDESPNGVTTGTSLDLHGGAVTDGNGQAAVVTLNNEPSTSGIDVDGLVPVVSSPTLMVAENAAAAAIGLAAPTDPNYSTSQLTITVATLPNDGTVTLADGTTPVTADETLTAAQFTGLEFTPTHDAFATSSALTYTATDPAANSATGTATLAIGAAIGSLAVSSPTLNVAENAAATAIGLTGPSDPIYSTSQLTITVATLPNDGTVTLADGATPVTANETLTAAQLIGLAFTPTHDVFSTSAALTYTVADPAANSATGTATLAIGAAIPSTIDVSGFFATDGNLNPLSDITLTDSDPVAIYNFQITVTNDPSFQSLSAFNLTAAQFATELQQNFSLLTPETARYTINLTVNGRTPAGFSDPGIAGIIGSGTSSLTTSVACYLRGTMIATPSGEKPIEVLRIGDLVCRAMGGVLPIRWIAVRSYVKPSHAVQPVCIRAGAIAENVPLRDLFVSPLHAMLIDGVLIPALSLVNGVSILQCTDFACVDYLHIELDEHAAILADGAASETFADCDNRWMFHNAEDFAALYPNHLASAWNFCAPRLEDGAMVAAVQARLATRARTLVDAVTSDSRLFLLADGRAVMPTVQSDGRFVFYLPTVPSDLRVLSRHAVPATLGLADDARRLGVALHTLTLRSDGAMIRVSPNDPLLADGFHEIEDGHRWTNGAGVLPADLLGSLEGPVEVELGADGLGYYAAEMRHC